MKVIAFVSLAILVSAGSARATEAQPFKRLVSEEALRQLIAEHSELKDPFSAQFRNVYAREVRGDKEGDRVKHIYCGELNAKNGFGAYTGWSKFLAHDLTDNPVVDVVDSSSLPSMFGLLCKDAPVGTDSNEA
jgi:hypothetical protein